MTTRRMAQGKRDRAAQPFDEAANLIEQGRVSVAGADPTEVVRKLRARAKGIRAGTDRPHKRHRRSSGEVVEAED